MNVKLLKAFKNKGFVNAMIVINKAVNESSIARAKHNKRKYENDEYKQGLYDGILISLLDQNKQIKRHILIEMGVK